MIFVFFCLYVGMATVNEMNIPFKKFLVRDYDPNAGSPPKSNRLFLWPHLTSPKISSKYVIF